MKIGTKHRRLFFEHCEGRVLMSASPNHVTEQVEAPAASAAVMPALSAPIATKPGDVILEAQWQSTDASRHAHLAVVVPVGRTIGNRQDYEVRITIHGDLKGIVEVMAMNNGGSRLFNQKFSAKSQPNWVIDEAGNTKTAVIPVSINAPNGKQTLSFRANIKDSVEAYKVQVEANVAVNTAPGGSIKGTGVNTKWANDYYDWRASAWDKTGGYEREIIRNMPVAAVSGNYAFNFSEQGSGPQARQIALDKGHFIPGQRSWQDQAHTTGSLLFDGKTRSQDFRQPLDTNNLENGWHSIHSLMVSGDHANAVAKMWFQVKN